MATAAASKTATRDNSGTDQEEEEAIECNDEDQVAFQEDDHDHIPCFSKEEEEEEEDDCLGIPLSNIAESDTGQFSVLPLSLTRDELLGHDTGHGCDPKPTGGVWAH